MPFGTLAMFANAMLVKNIVESAFLSFFFVLHPPCKLRNMASRVRSGCEGVHFSAFLPLSARRHPSASSRHAAIRASLTDSTMFLTNIAFANNYRPLVEASRSRQARVMMRESL